MHVVSLALDPKVHNPESVVAFRARAYGEQVEHYSVVVPSPATVTTRLSQKTTVYGVGGRHKLAKLWRMYAWVQKLIDENRCDVITSQDMYYLGLLGIWFAKRYHKGLEVQVLGIEKLTWFRKLIAMFVLKRASVIRALSPRLRDRLISEFGVSPAQIVVVSIYVDVTKLGLEVRTLDNEDARGFAAAEHAFQATYGKRFNFLSVSRLVPIKQIELQLEALAQLTQEFPNVLLHIVGNGPEEVHLKEVVTARRLTNHVVFHGYQSGYKLGLFYLACDCFVLTSDYEGWGMVIIEAATAGLPIIMTDVGCAGELIMDGKSGLVVPPQNVPALTGAMRRVLTDATLREQLSIGALQALKQLPSFEQLLKEYRQNWELALTKPL
jgi:phosphatidylinositol alpha-1,6-mannosyltransferase